MNKSELINCLSEETTFSKKDIARVLDGFQRVVQRTLKKGDRLQWARFGTWFVSHRPAREGINPATKERIKLGPINVPRFKAGKNLREVVR